MGKLILTISVEGGSVTFYFKVKAWVMKENGRGGEERKTVGNMIDVTSKFPPSSQQPSTKTSRAISNDHLYSW